jgi:hypothetical protein
MLRLLTRKYEFKDEDEREPLAQIVSVTFPPLLAIFQVRQPGQVCCRCKTAHSCMALVPAGMPVTRCDKCCRACWRAAACLRRPHSS